MQRSLVEYAFNRGLNKIFRLVSGIRLSLVCKINGRSVSCPVLLGVLCESSEPWMLDLLRQILPRRAGIFLDVGVNTGQTLVKLKSLDPDREYLGIEPNPFCVVYVNRLVAENNYRHCSVIPAALMDRCQILQLLSFSGEPSDSSASVVDGYRASRSICNQQSVVAISPSELLAQIPGATLGIIKIDVEGAEAEVLHSLKSVLKHHRPLVLLEVLPAYSRNNSMRVNRQRLVEDVLSESGYRIYRICKDDSERLLGLSPISEFGYHSSLSECDYMLVPGESAEDIASGFIVLENR